MTSYVRWAVSTPGGIKKARSIYKKLIREYVVSPAVFKAWIRLERESESLPAQKYVKWLHDAAIKADPTGAEPYLSYIADLVRARQPQKAIEVYWTGARTVEDREAFEDQYRKLMDGWTESMGRECPQDDDNDTTGDEMIIGKEERQ